MPVKLTPNAKAIIAAVAAVIVAGITAGQQMRGHSFRLADALPVAVVVLGAIQTRLIPNVPELPWAKAAVSAASAVLAAVSTVVAQDPSGVTAAKLLTVACGAFLVWFVPELAPELAVIENAVTPPTPAPAPPVLAPPAAEPIATLAAPAPAVQVVAGDHAASMGPVPAAASPIHDAVAASLATTAPLPAVTA